MGTKFDRYRIDEGDRVDLSELPTRDDAAFDGDKVDLPTPDDYRVWVRRLNATRSSSSSSDELS